MIGFKAFLSETAVATTRQGITHLHDMKPHEFVEWLKTIKKEAAGVLKDHKVVMKVDGIGARFGRGADGSIFFEGSRTGPVYEPGAFSRFVQNRGNTTEELVQRAIHYDNLLELFRTGSFMKAIPTDAKVVCEIFYNPMAEISDDGIKFVTVKYDKNKLGSLLTILPYTVLYSSTGELRTDKDEIVRDLMAKSTPQIKVIDPNLQLTSIDINGFINPIESIANLDVLQSRKAADKEAKQDLLNLINSVKTELTAYLLDHPGIEGKFRLGPNIEGVVLHVNGKPFKLITPEYKEAHR